MVLDIHIQKDEIRTLSNTIHKNQLKIKKVKCEPSYTVDGDVNWYRHYGEQYGDSGDVNWYSHYGEQYGDSLKKTKNRATIWSSNPTPGHIPRENHNSKSHIYPNVHCNTIYYYYLLCTGHGSNLLNVDGNRRMDKEE